MFFIKDVDRIEKSTSKRGGRDKYYHGRLFSSVFGCWKEKKLGFVGGGFAYEDGQWKFNSRTFNTMNPNNNDDGYHDTNKAMSESEKQLIRNVLDKLYTNDRWLELPPEKQRISIALLIADSNVKFQGTVKWAFHKEGYAFIRCAHLDEDIFVHCSAVRNRPARGPFLSRNDDVEFIAIKGDRGWEARDVVILDLD